MTTGPFTFEVPIPLRSYAYGVPMRMRTLFITYAYEVLVFIRNAYDPCLNVLCAYWILPLGSLHLWVLRLLSLSL